MTKSEEKAFLQQVIAKLGRESYCGDWLKEQFPAIESAIDSDYPPDSRALSFSESRKLADETVRAANEQAAAIEARAKSDAEKTRETACRFADSIRQNLKRDIESALHKIESF